MNPLDRYFCTISNETFGELEYDVFASSPVFCETWELQGFDVMDDFFITSLEL